MGCQNVLDPLCGCVGECTCGRYGTHTMLIERLIGNAYEVVKYVACNMAKIIQVANYLATLTLINSVACNDHSLFDLTLAPIQEMVLTGNVSYSEISTSTANPSIVTMRFIQDSVGGRNFTWPTTFKSHGDISLAPNQISQQIFAKNIDGTYDYANPMMYPRG